MLTSFVSEKLAPEFPDVSREYWRYLVLCTSRSKAAVVELFVAAYFEAFFFFFFLSRFVPFVV